jgi:hypothetical protein
MPVGRPLPLPGSTTLSSWDPTLPAGTGQPTSCGTCRAWLTHLKQPHAVPADLCYQLLGDGGPLTGAGPRRRCRPDSHQDRADRPARARRKSRHLGSHSNAAAGFGSGRRRSQAQPASQTPAVKGDARCRSMHPQPGRQPMATPKPVNRNRPRAQDQMICVRAPRWSEQLSAAPIRQMRPIMGPAWPPPGHEPSRALRQVNRAYLESPPPKQQRV